MEEGSPTLKSWRAKASQSWLLKRYFWAGSGDPLSRQQGVAGRGRKPGLELEPEKARLMALGAAEWERGIAPCVAKKPGL